MPAKAKKILITTESHEVLVVRKFSEFSFRGFCPACGEQVDLLSFDSAVTRAGIGGRELLLRSQTGEVHSVEAASGHLLICKLSLLLHII